LWKNYLYSRNPTPTINDLLLTIQWPHFTLEGEDYLDIEKTLTPMKKRFGGRLDAWFGFMQRFRP
jgi:hypothetical protein